MTGVLLPVRIGLVMFLFTTSGHFHRTWERDFPWGVKQFEHKANNSYPSKIAFLPRLVYAYSDIRNTLILLIKDILRIIRVTRKQVISLQAQAFMEQKVS
jgi:hypothetical protein